MVKFCHRFSKSIYMKKLLYTNPVLKTPRKKKKPTLKDVFFLKVKAPASKGRKAKRNRKSKY